MGRILAMGDIHGGLKALKQVLNRANVSKDDHIIFLGDYVDGWSESAQVIDFLIEYAQEFNCTFIRGNHDELVREWLENDDLNPKWLKHGGRSSIYSYTDYSEKQREDHIKFFKSLQNYYVDDKNRLFVHAGFQNQSGPEFEWNPLTFYWDRTLWELVIAMDHTIDKNDPTYPKRLTHYPEIFIGHTPVTRIGEENPTQR
ncbi:MAG: metallophosphoesterase, partial [Leeuwenhoekiella sp.]